MNQLGILLKKAKELKKMNVDNKNVVIGYSTSDAEFYGSIWIDNNINPVRFAYLFNENRFNYIDEYAPVNNNWIKDNIENTLYQLLEIELELDKIQYNSTIK